MKYERFHRGSFHAFGKIFGFGLFVVAGLVALVNGVQLLNGNISLTINGVVVKAKGLKIGLVALMAVLSTLGLLMLTAKPYRSDGNKH